MGVRGLKSYIEENNLYLKDCNFKDSKLLIDGCNLCRSFYTVSKFDLKHGGDYYAFEILMRKFFRTLKNCKIEPFVILDGGINHINKQQGEERIKKQKDLSFGRRGYYDHNFPTLLQPVFIQMLSLLKVPFIQCMEAADKEIAALASQRNCPVLSNDSDFFIFELKAGVLPITHFQWDKVSTQKFIPAKTFLISNFCKRFSNLNQDLLPVFAALAENDCVKLNVSLSWERFSRCSGPHARLDGILHWLSVFSNKKKAIRALVDGIKDQVAKNEVQRTLTTCMSKYKVIKSNLAQFFSKEIAPSKLPKALEVLPDWIRMPLFEGKLSSIVVNALVLQSVQLSTQVEDFDLSSSNETSRPIRQVLYGLLLSGQKQRDDRKPIVARVDPEACYVEEYDREGVMLTTFWVRAACPFSGKDLHLKTLNETPRELRLQVLCDTLGVTKPIFKPFSSPIADKFQFPVLVTCYWLRKADPQPCLEHLWALLLGFVFGELSDHYKGKTGIALVRNRLNNLRLHTTPRRPDLQAAHTYSQWQACMRDAYRLNQLLCLPVPALWPEPELSRLYCGPLVHQAALRLMKGATPESFLSGGTIPRQLFKDLQQAVRDSLDDHVWETLEAAKEEKKKISHADKPRRRRRAHTVGNVEELTRQFEQMCDDDEDDDGYGCGRKGKARSEDEEVNFHIRMRHKKKSRALRDHSPGKLNKRDRVIWV